MAYRTGTRRVGWALVAVLLGMAGLLMPAGRSGHAQVRSVPARPVAQATTRFAGVVASVSGPSVSPTGFTLVMKARSIDLRVAPGAIFNPKSAEAEVEGFMAGDYAVVTARRINRAWVAEQIDFDVRPVNRPRDVTVAGTVLKITPNGKRFLMALDTGGTRWVLMNAATQFRTNGQLVFNPPPLLKGERVTVVMRSTVAGWLAVEVNLRPTGGAYRV